MPLLQWIERARGRAKRCFVCKRIVHAYVRHQRLEDLTICGVSLSAEDQFWHLEHHIEDPVRENSEEPDEVILG